ncbi:MAG: FAD-dependent thymidylate synthase [Candidatus Pacebacteria bacterium]|nr:FAD-dependent thymidylate synthase [Candidatus Paceibacterota bacterium]
MTATETPAPAQATLRPTSPGLEALLQQRFTILDHGFIRVIDYMGNDDAVVQAARVSYGRGTKSRSEDSGLIQFLMQHHHSTPFEMCVIKFHVKLPIFIARQWIRHRTASVNEVSARYSILAREFYLPAPEVIAAQSSSNRQGRGEALPPEEALEVLRILRDDATTNYDHYQWLLNDQNDGEVHDPSRHSLSRELARMNLTLNSYTEWYWSINLHNLFHFLRLRSDPHAQYEIRAYAEKMLEITAAWVPLSHQAFVEHRLESATLSKTMVELLRQQIKGQVVTFESSGLSRRQWDHYQSIIHTK